jgi:hypothetical protein
MGRLRTTLTAAAASGLTALAVTVAVPALGDDTPRAKDGANVEHHETDTTPQLLQACLASHGATGVPGDEDAGRALKQWIVAHQSDESAKAALRACDVYFDGGKKPGDHAQPGEKPDCAGPASGKHEAVAAAKARRARVHARPAT